MMLASGVSGELRVSYMLAARLGRWQVSMAEDVFADGRSVCTAEVVSSDAYWLAHGGLFDLHLDVGRFRWTWRGVSIAGLGPITVLLQGRPEVKEG